MNRQVAKTPRYFPQFVQPWIVSIGYAACMVVSWGDLDYFRDLPRTGVLVCVILAPLFQVGMYGNLKRGADSGESVFFFALLAGLGILGPAFLIPFFSRKQGVTFLPPAVFRYTGLAMFAAGYWVRSIAVRTLKKQFSLYVTVQEDHQLITSGIYSLIRHPIYLGVIVSLSGLVLVFPSIYGFLFVLIYSMLLTRRMTQEERLLFKHFGSVYEEYSSKSFRLIPHIY